jgi:chemotaxis-related protein WspD
MSHELEPSQAPEPAAPEIAVCWHSVGVYGDQTCPQLKEFVHCRNCPVYSAAGSRLLDRTLPANYRAEWAAHYGNERRMPEAGSISVVLFQLQGEWLALPAQAFQEVAERRRIHSLPHRRQGIVLGLVNVRGELLISVSLGHLLGLEKAPPPDELRKHYHRLLVANWGGNRFAFPVDAVQGPQRFHAHDLKAVPATVARASLSFTQGMLQWEQRSAGFLDPDALFATLNRSLL